MVDAAKGIDRDEMHYVKGRQPLYLHSTQSSTRSNVQLYLRKPVYILHPSPGKVPLVTQDAHSRL